ncbi:MULTISPECIES: DUF5667 domain-containing protein [Streptomyces]|uniref:DUF5667 domain-containing protein n=1 Tax=Streptomyces thermogriseus TaxID=75292 RepID=A0ABN1STF0_9ACTN|nr:DUF5667 domain-containing protein [Streptomyces thermovulgaris]
MIANLSAHRRANAFARALEELSGQGTAAEQSEGPAPAPAAAEQTEQGRMLALATALDALPRPELDPEVKAVQRARLVAAMEAMLQESTAGEATDASVPGQRSHRAKDDQRTSGPGKLWPRTRLGRSLAAGGLGLGVAAGAFGGVAAASSDALPGDSLYGLKRGIEDFKLTYLTDGADEQGRAHLALASTRLSEARRLLDRGRGRPLDRESLGEIRRTLSGMRREAAEGHRLLHEAYENNPDSLGPIQALSTFSRTHRATWSEVRAQLPAQLDDVSRQVSSVFDAIDEEVAPLRSLLPQPAAPDGDDDKRHATSPAPSPAASGTGPSAVRPSTGSDPSPSGQHPSSSSGPSAGSEDRGLIGGSTGDLLDPPELDGTPSPSVSRPVPSAPEVTVPPLLPGLLPGFGVEAEDAE